MKAGTITNYFMKENSLQIDWFKILEKFGFPIFIALIFVWISYSTQQNNQAFMQKMIDKQEQKNSYERQLFVEQLDKQSELHRNAFEKINERLDSITHQIDRRKTK